MGAEDLAANAGADEYSFFELQKFWEVAGKFCSPIAGQHPQGAANCQSIVPMTDSRHFAPEWLPQAKHFALKCFKQSNRQS